MADEDEELSHLRAPDAGDVDLTEETQDFRFLDKLTFVRTTLWHAGAAKS
jgi:tRNA-splicing endonuclease subunit Sen54